MAWKVTVNNVEKTQYVMRDSCSVTEQMAGRSSAVISFLPSYIPTIGEEIVIYEQDGTTKRFGGYLWAQTMVPHGGKKFSFRWDCVDYCVLFDRLTYSASYSSQVLLKTVLTDIASALTAAGFGITLLPGQPNGPYLEPFSWNNIKLSNGVSELISKTGYVVTIDELKYLSGLQPSSTPSAPISLTENALGWKSFTWRKSLADYFNSVTMICGPSAVMVSYEVHDCDGVTKSWSVSNPPSAIGEGMFNWTVWIVEDGYNVGDAGHYGYELVQPYEGAEDPLAKWTWRESTLTIAQKAGETAKPNGYYIRYDRSVQLPFSHVVSDVGAEGIYSGPQVSAPAVTTVAEADQLGQGYLRQYKRMPRIADLISETPGWETGQAVSVNLPTSRGVSSATFLVTELRIKVYATRKWEFTCTLQEAVSGTAEWTPSEFQKGLGGTTAVTTSGGIVVSGGSGSGVSRISYPMGGSRALTVAPSTWAPIAEWIPVKSPLDFQAQVRAWFWAKNSGITVNARITKGDDGVTFGTTVATFTAVTSQDATERLVAFVAENGKYYRIEVNPSAAGEGCGCIGYLESA